MGKPIIDDELWALIEPLLPPSKPRRVKYPGRKPIADRAALTGILFVLKTGIRWSDLPSEMGCGSGVSCWRRLRDWQQAGVWDRLHAVLLAKLRAAGKIDFCRVVVDSSSIRAVGAGGKTGPNPTDRARPGSKHHIATDANGTPIAAILTGANRNDVTQLVPLIEAIVPIGGVRGRPLSRPGRVYADRGYDHDKYRCILHERNIPTSIARRGHPHGSGLGKVRWVVERTHAWLHHFRRLRTRFERRADIHEALLKLGCCLIC
ncbi:IS5 family transposase [Burkholderia gladioli]|uniref:IS5 family transposase n=1 Tax=Burkholderia gladioli TaxID=28095 RepID=UPI0012D4BB42|nr:IS5 family transposase [Burkholderia gladioli]